MNEFFRVFVPSTLGRVKVQPSPIPGFPAGPERVDWGYWESVWHIKRIPDMAQARAVCVSERARAALESEYPDDFWFYPELFRSKHGDFRMWTVHFRVVVECDESGVGHDQYGTRSGVLRIARSKLPRGMFSARLRIHRRWSTPDKFGSYESVGTTIAAPYCTSEFAAWWRKNRFTGAQFENPQRTTMKQNLALEVVDG